MRNRTRSTSAAIVLMIAYSVPLVSLAVWPPNARANPNPPVDGATYRLSPESSHQHGCFPPCLCPLMTIDGVRGTFKLIHTEFDGVLHKYAVVDVNWTVPSNDFLHTLRIIGSGTYLLGSPDPATVMQHRMMLDLRVGDEPVQHFDSGWVPIEDSSNAHIRITVSLNNMFCLDTAIVIDADPVPESEIHPYLLVKGSTFQRGCFDPCDCLLGPEHPMVGRFALVPLVDMPLFFTEFAVVDVSWNVLFSSVGESIPISGFGVYQLLGDFVAQHRLALELVVGDEERAHFDSGAVFGGGLDMIDILVSMNNLECLDTVLHVVAAPVVGRPCPSATGVMCDEGEFCKKPVGHCNDDVSGVCTPIPAGCIETVIDPVCGCDGVTYGNECQADAAAVSIAHYGECEQVCFGNDCPAVNQFCKYPEGTCGDASVPGACTPIPDICPDVWDPVCGCDGVTYRNKCQSDAARVSVDYRGECGVACEPLPDGSRCTNFACSVIPEVSCMATVLHRDIHTGAITTVACECLDFNLCHVEFGGATPIPVGNCPEPDVCEVIGTDTDNDGIDDEFTAKCMPIGACCVDISGSIDPYPDCGETTQQSCDGLGGFFAGVGTECAADEACCLIASGPVHCVDTDPFCCDSFGGVRQGPGSNCADIVDQGGCGQLCAVDSDCAGSNQFCKFPEGSCGTASIPGVCTPRTTGCPDLWDPVCGCDGVTYGNECEADAAGESILHRGECDRICTQLGPEPPCASGEFCKSPMGTCDDPNVTGVCTVIPDGCPEYYEPVCGCDGVTYGNKCEADAAAVSIDHMGECEATPCAATRFLSNTTGSYCPQVPQTVRILLAPPDDTTIVALEDGPPTGWVVINISHEGTFDTANWKVKWGPFFAPSIPRDLSYDVIPVNDPASLACFVGTISVDGLNERICGDACIGLACPPFMEADVPQPPCSSCSIGDCTSCPEHGCRDGRISLCELIGYACAWRAGCNDDLAGTARTAYIWRNGECYCWDDAEQNWFPTMCPTSDSLQCGVTGGSGTGDVSGPTATAGTATVRVRGLPGHDSSETPLVRVAVLIRAPQNASVMALEFDIPKGWRATAVSDDGGWDSLHRKIKWGPFFGDLSRTVTFELVRGGDRAIYRPHRFNRTGLLNGLTGRVSFGGAIQPITIK